MKVVKEIFLTEEERDTLKKATEILNFISERVGDTFSYRTPAELDDLLVSAHGSCFEDY